MSGVGEYGHISIRRLRTWTKTAADPGARPGEERGRVAHIRQA
jgi:hypothetical protein